MQSQDLDSNELLIFLSILYLWFVYLIAIYNYFNKWSKNFLPPFYGIYANEGKWNLAQLKFI